MNPISNELSKAVRLALTVGAASVAVVPAVYAQDDAETLETITVVGSRIKRTDIETSQPVFVIERADLQRTGLTSVGDILQELTSNGATLNTTFNNGGNGETRVDLRNLGSNRTLVLVNGRRWVTTLDGAVDLNTIPVSVIERVEVLKDGASAIYGSDAIAGVINITTRDTYDGAEASAYLGENEEGDGRTQLYDFTIGATTERSNIVFNASYAKQDPIFAGDREISAVPLYGLPRQQRQRRRLVDHAVRPLRPSGCPGHRDPDPGPRRHVPERLQALRPVDRRLQLRSGQLPADPAGAHRHLRAGPLRHHRQHQLQHDHHGQRAQVGAAAGGDSVHARRGRSATT